MAGSQLKQLKAALKANGLVGQTNVKRKNKGKVHEARRQADDKKKILGGIRTQFNQFDQRINRAKHDYTIVQKGQFVKAGSKQHNDVSKTKSVVEKNLRLAYDATRKHKGRTGGLKDRRFGENNLAMTAEEKMLARFTKERQAGSKNAFSLESDEEDDDAGFTLTHSGKSLSFEEEGLGSGTRYVDEELMPEEQSVPKRKTKAEVMKEVIAKSKFYKHQRQQEFQKNQDEIMDLDDEFGEVLGELHTTQPRAPQFSSKSAEELAYDAKVRELTYDRRSVPADRTKTDEEVAREHADKMKKLEDARLARMSGQEDRAAEGDDLDDFWAGSDAEQSEGESEQSEQMEEELDNEEEHPGTRFPRSVAVGMPSTTEELHQALHELTPDKQVSHVRKIIDTYKPHLAAGNKEKMDTFVGLLFEEVIAEGAEGNDGAFEALVVIVKKLAESYNEALVARARAEVEAVQAHIEGGAVEKRDFVFFVVVGYLFSTSDHFHLVVTPTLIVMNEYLAQLLVGDGDVVGEIGRGLFVCDVLLQYQFFAKRFVPELVHFIERALVLLVPDSDKLDAGLLLNHSIPHTSVALAKSEKFPEVAPLSLTQVFAGADEPAFKCQLLAKAIGIVDRFMGLWKDLGALVEILGPFQHIFKHIIKFYALQLPQLQDIVGRMSRLIGNCDRKPLTLQQHRALAIPTFAPKFEENFNPDKKSYDVNRERQEVNKMKHQLKKEKKALVKDMRKQTQFVAREQIKEKKQQYDEYHKKMAHIVNSISTVEGAEKNAYAKERKQRKNK